MSRIVTFGIDCPHDGCDGFASSSTLYLGEEVDDPIRIDIEMSVSQIQLECDTCGCNFYIGDVEVFDDLDGECPVEDDDEEDWDNEEEEEKES